MSYEDWRAAVLPHAPTPGAMSEALLRALWADGMTPGQLALRLAGYARRQDKSGKLAAAAEDF